MCIDYFLALATRSSANAKVLQRGSCRNIKGEHQIFGSFEVVSQSRCRNIIGEHEKFWGAPLAKGHAHFSSGCDFIIRLGKPKLCTKFQVASFSRCTHIKGKPQIFWSSPNPGPHPLFLLVRSADGPWQTPAACQI